MSTPNAGTNDERAMSAHWAHADSARRELAHRASPATFVCAAKSLLQLGLREPAAIMLRGIPRDAPEATELVPLAPRLDAMPNCVVRAEERIEVARHNVFIHKDLRDGVGNLFDQWARHQERFLWFRAADDQQIGLDPSRDPRDPAAWHRFGDAVGLARGVALPDNAPAAGPAPKPLILDGLREPWLWRRAHRHLAPRELGARATIHILEERLACLLDALAVTKLDDELTADRARLWVGDGATERLLAHLDDSAGTWSGLTYATDQPARPSDAMRKGLRDLPAAQSARYRATTEANRARYADRDAAWWSSRYRSALSGTGEPLRVLVITTRFSTYIQHASRDIAAAFRRLGARAHLLIEPDDGSETNALALASAVRTHEPDLVVLINYTRGQFKGSIPESLPFVTWVQDALPGLFDDTSAAQVGPLEAVVGSVYKQLVTEHGYPASRCLRFPVPASSAKFSRDPAADPECDLLIAMNHAETPGAMTDRLERECVRGGAPAGLGAALCGAVREAMDAWRSGWLAWTTSDAADPVYERFGLDPQGANAASLNRVVVEPMANRVLRHRLVDWAGELCVSRGLRLRLCGRGWEQHPRWARFASGPLQHGDELRDAYASAALTLHTGAGWFMHQRLYECALAGGLPAVMLKPDDAYQCLRPAREHARAAGVVAATHEGTQCVRATDHALYSRSVALAQRFAFAPWAEGVRISSGAMHREPVPSLLREGLIPVGAGDGSSQPRIEELHDLDEQLRQIEVFSLASFRSAEELASLAERAVSDPAWREGHRHAVRHAAEGGCTYEHAAERIAAFMAAQFEREASPSLRAG